MWIASGRKELKAFPRPVQRDIGHALEVAQRGGTPVQVKPLKGFKGAGVLEVTEDHAGDTYRAVYTVRLAGRVYVLHAFQTKSNRRSRTPRHVIELIEHRLKDAERVHAELEAAR